MADFGIKIEPCIGIKAQALADFIVETTGTTPNDPNQELKLYVDGSSTRSSSGADIIIISSARVKMEHAVRFEFMASNNEAEYEALFLGINICYNSGAPILSAFSDSQLIVSQVNGEIEAKDDSVRMYLQRVQTMVKQLKTFNLSYNPRSKNT